MDESTTHSALLLAQYLQDNPDVLNKAKENPAELETLAYKVIAERKNPLTWDKWIYRVVVCSLGLTILLVVISAFVLALQHNGATTELKIPEVLTAIGSAAVGALAGLLAPTPANKSV